MNTKSIKKSFLLKEKTLGSKELNRSESSSVGGVGHASDELAFGVVGLLLMLCLFFFGHSMFGYCYDVSLFVVHVTSPTTQFAANSDIFMFLLYIPNPASLHWPGNTIKPECILAIEYQ